MMVSEAETVLPKVTEQINSEVLTSIRVLEYLIQYYFYHSSL